MDTSESLQLNKEHEEVAEQSLQFEVSGPSSTCFPAGPDLPAVLDDTGKSRTARSSKSSKSSKAKAPASSDGSEDDDDGMADEATSESEGDDEEPQSSKGNGGRSNRNTDRGQHAQEIPEDFHAFVFNVLHVFLCKTNHQSISWSHCPAPIRTFTTLMKC